MARDEISEVDARQILKAQLPIDEKIACADFVINNSGSLEETKNRVLVFWQGLKDLHQQTSENKCGRD